MAVIGLVATDAALRNRGMQVPTAVTIGATDMSMTSKEGEASFMGVIEFLRVPVRGAVAVAALLALVTFVNVIGRVATETFCG